MTRPMILSPEKGDVHSADSVTYVRKKLAVCKAAHSTGAQYVLLNLRVQVKQEQAATNWCRELGVRRACLRGLPPGCWSSHLGHGGANEVDR